MTPRREALAFLAALFGSALPTKGAELRIALWDKPTKRSTFWPTARSAADDAQGRRDLYVSASLTNGDLGSRLRVKNTTSAAIPGVWADIDVVGGPENKKPGHAAATLDDALDLARSVAEPTITLTSGYGLQAWWLLEDGPWVFRTVDERERAARLTAQWNALVDERARARGYRTDHTHDLARLMRLPDTLNAKGGREAPCHGWPDPVGDQDGPRYSVEELGRLVHGVAPAGTHAQLNLGDVAAFDPAASPPADKLLALIENSDQFKRTWRHTRRDGQLWSASEWDLSLASQADQAGWADEEIAQLLAMHRREYYGGEKLDRPDYFARTIAKARDRGQRQEQTRERDDALDDLSTLADQATPDEDATIGAFNLVMGGPIVKEFVQYGRDHRSAEFSLILADGDRVDLGLVGNVTDPRRFSNALLVSTAHLLPAVKRDKWDGAIRALFKIRVVHEAPEDTAEGVVDDWLERYLYERLPAGGGDDARDDACRRKDPFEHDGHVHVYATAFASWVRQALRVTSPDHEIRRLLRAAGFGQQTVHYTKVDDQPSTRSYYARRRNGID